MLHSFNNVNSFSYVQVNINTLKNYEYPISLVHYIISYISCIDQKNCITYKSSYS